MNTTVCPLERSRSNEAILALCHDVKEKTIANKKFYEAVLGDEVKVETLDGEKVLKIPPSTQYGKILTLKYHGVPFIGSNNKRGDHFVQVIIKTPNQITDEEKKLYAKLYELQSKKQIHNDSIIDKVKQVLGSGKD